MYRYASLMYLIVALSVGFRFNPHEPNYMPLRRHFLSSTRFLGYLLLVRSLLVAVPSMWLESVEQARPNPICTRFVLCFSDGRLWNKRSTRTKLHTVTPSLLVVYPIPRVLTSRQIPPRRGSVYVARVSRTSPAQSYLHAFCAVL
jgi:hypothetical protein